MAKNNDKAIKDRRTFKEYSEAMLNVCFCVKSLSYLNGMV